MSLDAISRFTRRFGVVSAIGAGCCLTSGQAATVLQVVPESDGRLRLEWSTARAPLLEAAGSLGTPWQPVTELPVVSAGIARLTITPGDQSRFFRLHESPVTGIAGTSPLPGETGVAVTRETVVRFSAPLAANALLGTNQFFAEAAGRRLLSRVEMGTDRRSATLFYLEPVPSSSRVLVTVVGTGLSDENGIEVDADGNRSPGGTRVFTYDTAPVTSTPNTAISGHVYASERLPDGKNRPLAGVLITVDGAEEALRAKTDAQGFFQLNDCPAGRFFVHIDGRPATGSSWPGGAYYPYVGKAWTAIQGITNTLPGGTGDIYLPLIPAGALRSVSPVAATTITFLPALVATNPALAGVQIVVPPNALFADSGVRGGRVGIAPVPPDRLPEPLPPGLEMPIVITIQTDGPQNFAEPVPVRFPNLPDPKTGLKLPPGAKSGLWSFNHDTGRWEPQGRMTVSADGNYLDTDPGVGVRQPGWHGFNPGTNGDGDAPDAPQVDDDPPPDPTAPSPFEKCKSEITNLMNSAFDCAYGTIIPGKLSPDSSADGCAIGAGLGAIGTVRDCLADPSGCKATIVNNTGGALIGCSGVLGDALAPASKVLGPVGTIAGLIQGCVLGPGLNFCAMADCLEQSSGDSFCVPDEYEAGMQRWLNDWDFLGNIFSSGPSPARARPLAQAILGEAPPEFIAEAHTNAFLTQARFSAALRQYMVAFYGSTKWFPGTVADAQLSGQFLRQLDTATSPLGDGGAIVTPGERTALLALPLPAGVTAADANAVISRMERIGNGTIPDAELNLRALLGSAVKFAEMSAVFQSLGWTSSTEAFNQGLLQISAKVDVRCKSAGGVAITPGSDASNGGGGGGGGGGGQTATQPIPVRPLSYLLQNMDTGFALRGKLQTGASLASLIMAPNTYYALYFVDDLSGTTSVSFFKSAEAGQPTKIPCSIWLNGGVALRDTDGDGLNDMAERVIGTSLTQADTDGDGQIDRLELANGTSPADGVALTTGLVGQAAIPGGGALTVAAEGRVLYAGGAATGLTLLDVSQPLTPVQMARLNFPGQNFSFALAAQGGLVALGGPSGLALVDARTPTAPTLITNLPLATVNAAVWSLDDVAALTGSTLHLLEATTGRTLLQYGLGTDVGQDVQAVGDYLYVLTNVRLLILRRVDGLLLEVGRISLSGTISPLEIGRKLFVGGGKAYFGAFGGFSILDVLNPALPTVLGAPPSTQAGIHDLVANGAGLLLPVVSFAGRTTLAVGAYDVRNPGDTTRFLTSWETPGEARALVLHRGLAYVADSGIGVQVLNYLSPDLAGVAPTLTYTANFPVSPARVSYGSRLRLQIDAQDDVQVREVTAFVDDVPVATAERFPFQLSFTAPNPAPGRTNFSLQLRATDTAGNSRSTPPLLVALAVNIDPPKLLTTFPYPGTRPDSFGLTNVTVDFDRPLAPASVTPTMLSVLGAGTDKKFGTADDVVRAGTTVLSPDGKRLEFIGTTQFPDGVFRVQLTPGARSTTVDALARLEPVTWTFEVVSILPRLTAGTSPSSLIAAPLEGLAVIEAALDQPTTPARAPLAVFSLKEAGPDRTRGTADDITLPLSSVILNETAKGFQLTPATRLGAGRYRLSLSGIAYAASVVDFELRSVPNIWRTAAGGRWTVATNWASGVPLVNDFLSIPRLTPNLSTTNNTLSTLSRIECAADFVQEPGNLILTGEGYFDGYSRFLSSTLGAVKLSGGGTIINRGTMQLSTGSGAVNRTVELQDITLENRGELTWDDAQLGFTHTNGLLVNGPTGVFSLGARATSTHNGGGTFTTVGRISNAGLLRKSADTNPVSLRTIKMENAGQIQVTQGVLTLGETDGPGTMEVQSGAGIIFTRLTQMAPAARIFGGGDIYISGGPTNAPQELTHRHEITGLTVATTGYTDIRQALNFPGLQFRSSGGWFRFHAPSTTRRLWVIGGSFEGLEVNAPALTEVLDLEEGRFTGPGPVTVSQNLRWKNGWLGAGGEISVAAQGEIYGSGKLDQRQIHILPDATVVCPDAAFIGTSARTLEGRIVNDGTLIKRGPGTLRVQVSLENRSLIRLEAGELLIERQPQGDGQLFFPRGELQFAGGSLRLYLQTINGSSLGLGTNGVISGYGKITTESGFGNRLRNSALIRLNVPGRTLELVDHDYEQTAAGELEVTLGAAGIGRLSGNRGAILKGRLRIVLEPGFETAVGQSFVLLSMVRSGTFNEVILPPLGAGRRLQVSYPTGQVVVAVVSDP